MTCKTPDAVYHIYIHPKHMGCIVRLPVPINLNAEQAKEIEDQMHDAMEAILAPFFGQDK